MTIHDEPPPLARMLEHAAVMIHHGGLNTTETALAAGRPQLLLPIHLEHNLTARAVESLGVGRSLAGRYRAAEARAIVAGSRGYRLRGAGPGVRVRH